MNIQNETPLWKMAESCLKENIVLSNEGSIIVAGGTQFKTFWVRDFCFAVPGLLAIKQIDLVKNQIQIALNHQRNDGLIARGFDVMNPKHRVIASCFGLSSFFSNNYESKNIKAEYLGEHGTPSVDSNLLILLVCCQWMDVTHDNFFFKKYDLSLKKAFEYILQLKQNHFLVQPAFSDWQDSASRHGSTFYLNLLFCRVLEKLQNQNISWAFGEDLETWKKNLWEHFFDRDNGLFLSQLDRKQYSLETQLWCIEENIFEKYISRTQLWSQLLASPLWSSFPGRPVHPQYPSNDISWTTKAVGLRHYHDQFYWSWLMGESLKIARLMQDKIQIEQITHKLTELSLKHNTIHEIYEGPKTLLPVSRWLYTSEAPFTWGAAKIIEAFSSTQIHSTKDHS